MNWVISLILKNGDTLEERLGKILEFILKKYPDISVTIKDIDATGKIGNHWKQKINLDNNGFSSNKSELFSVVKEEGQIFELEIGFNNVYLLIVRRGEIVDFIGKGNKPSVDEIGPYTNEDINAYKPLIE